MITKRQLLDSMRHETKVIQHIASRIPAEHHDWRPTPGQRSVRELMQYLTAASLSPAIFCVTGNWQHAPGLRDEAMRVTPEDFPAAMDRQMERIEETLADVDEAAATTAPGSQPWGETIPQSRALMDTVLKTFVAYRMQLFLYAKQAGNAQLGSADCWAGVPSFR